MKYLLVLTLMMSVQAQASFQNHFKKVVWIVFENTDFPSAMKQTDFKALTQKGVLLTNLKAVVHPSQGNYINMMAGSNYGVRTDSNVDLNVRHLGDLLEEKNLDWRVYAENYPGNCFLGARSNDYVRKHIPFLSFTNVSKNPDRCKKIENAELFKSDIEGDHLTNFSLYIPNLQNDGHNTNVDFAGKWLTNTFGSILNSLDQRKDLLFIITFDESESYLNNNQVFTVLLGDSLKAGTTNDQAIGHPALLRLIEEEFGLNSLGQADQASPSLFGLWKE